MMRKYRTFEKIQCFIVIIACISIVGVYFQNRPAKEVKVASVVNGFDSLKIGLQLNNPIDFDSYWDINKDVYAYLYIDDTKVDYPVLQHESDNSHYLNYTIDGKHGYPGSIYSEKETSKKFDDPNTIIYGHNMSAAYGTMFYDLMKYEEEAFFDAHRYIYMYTPDAIYQYEVFAAYTFDNRHLLYSYDFKDKEVFKSYLDEVFHMGNGIIDQDMKVTNEDKILTLSTCTNVRDEERFLVQAVLKERVECKYKSAVETTHTMKGMKDPDILQVEENKKEDTVSFKDQTMADLKFAIPYLVSICSIIGVYAVLLHIQRRSKEDQEFYDKYVKGIHGKLRFVKFLILQIWQEIKQFIHKGK
ncbi:class B sortase [Amedibacillus sp. YH-ame6]